MKKSWRHLIAVAAVASSAVIATKTSGSPARVFQFQLLLQLEADEPSPAVDPVIVWNDWRKLSGDRWPNGGVVLVSSPNCRPCEQFKKQTLADPRVKALLSDETMTEIPTKDWRRWWKPGMRTPFIVFVRPPNSIVGRMHCPLAPEEFIRAFTKHKIGKTDEKKSN